ncbi:MAG: DUF3047 domain-containing protein [Candidatus Omnitrophota bacterium]
MKRLTGFLQIILLIIFMSVAAFHLYFFIKMKYAPEEKKIIKEFSFSSEEEISALTEKKLVSKSTDYKVVEYEGEHCVKALSENSASALFFKESLSYGKDPFIRWDWKVEKFPDRGKEEKLGNKDDFDFAAQVYVIFYSRFFLKAKAIQYVWSEGLSVGEQSESPYTKNVKLLVLESGLSEKWKHEDRNINNDYLKLFGEPLSADITAIAFMTDSDSTGSTAAAYYDNFNVGYSGDEIELNEKRAVTVQNNEL